MKPTFDNVLIKKDRGTTHTATGIALPPNSQAGKQKGTLEAVGPQVIVFKDKKFEGVKVIYSPHEDYLKFEDDEYAIVNEKGIVATL